MESAVKIPLSERFNFRVIIFVGVIALLVGYPVYVLVREQVSGGVRSAGGGYTQVNLKALGNFEFDNSNGTINDVPAKWRELDGKKLVLEGEIYAPNEASDEIHRFELVYNIQKCCFNGPPKVQERVFCIVPDGKTAQYVSGTARVKGTLHINVKSDMGKINALYVLDVHSVEPAG